MRAGTRAARARALRAALARAAPPNRARLDARLEQAGRACGCSTAALAVLVAVTAVVVWWPGAAAAAPIVACAALAGKLAGLAGAEIWLWWAGRVLR